MDSHTRNIPSLQERALEYVHSVHFQKLHSRTKLHYACCISSLLSSLQSSYPRNSEPSRLAHSILHSKFGQWRDHNPLMWSRSCYKPQFISQDSPTVEFIWQLALLTFPLVLVWRIVGSCLRARPCRNHKEWAFRYRSVWAFQRPQSQFLPLR